MHVESSPMASIDHLRRTRARIKIGYLVPEFPGQTHILTEKSEGLEMWIGLFRPILARLTCRSEAGRILLQDNPEGDFCRRLAPIPTQAGIR